MATLVGGIDDRLRPYMRVEYPGADDGFIALLDTGFNGELFLEEPAAFQLGVQLRGTSELVHLASGPVQEVRRGVVTIRWLGVVRRAEVLVAVVGSVKPRRADDPIALVGTALLNPHLVLLDFANRTIEIESEA